LKRLSADIISSGVCLLASNNSVSTASGITSSFLILSYCFHNAFSLFLIPLPPASPGAWGLGFRV
jgi:hypothetical protein